MLKALDGHPSPRHPNYCHIRAKSHPRPRMKRCVGLFSLCVFNKQTERMWRRVWWHICRRRNRGPIIFPIRKTKTNWNVRHFQRAITASLRPDLVRCATLGPGRDCVCSQDWYTSIGWYTVRRVPSTSISHRRLGGVKLFCDRSLQDLQTFGLAPHPLSLHGFSGREQA